MGWRTLIDFVEKVKDIFEELDKIFKFIIKIIGYVKNIWYYVLNPLKIVEHIITGIIKSIQLIFDLIFNKIFGFNYKYSNKKLNNLTSKKKNRNKNIYISQKLLEIVLLILCPPIIILNKKGLSGILHFIIATLLTLFYYVPGLIYSTFFII